MSAVAINAFQSLFHKRISKKTNDLLSGITNINQPFYHEAEKVLHRLSRNGPSIHFGTTNWNFPVHITLNELINHSLIVGTSGAGKSYAALLILNQILHN